MIIDTTQTKIERQMDRDLEDRDIFAPLIAAAERRERRRHTSCDDVCSCHINAPCNYCVSLAECELCGELSPGEDMVEVDGELSCEGCSMRLAFLDR